MAKILIAYYSRKGDNYVSGKIVNLPVGNTELAAGCIRELTGADVFIIDQLEKYSENYRECTKQAANDLKNNARPKLSAMPDNFEDCDILVLAYPNYCGTMPMAVWTFLDSIKTDGLTILPLCTHEGSGMGRSEGDIKKLAPTADIRKGLAIKGSETSSSKGQIEAWLKAEKLI